VNEPNLSLREVERKVIMMLAGQGPKSGYDFHLGGRRERGHRKAIMSNGNWIKVLGHIGPKGLNIINRVNTLGSRETDERGRRKDLYWLTPKGITLSFLEDANPKVLLDYVKKYYPDSQEMQVFFHIASTGIVPSRVLKDSYSMSDEEGEFNLESVMISYLDYVKSGIHVDKKQARKLAEIFKQHPEYNPLFRDIWSAIYQSANETDEALSHESYS